MNVQGSSPIPTVDVGSALEPRTLVRGLRVGSASGRERSVAAFPERAEAVTERGPHSGSTSAGRTSWLGAIRATIARRPLGAESAWRGAIGAGGRAANPAH